MRPKIVLSILLNLVAVAAPAGVLLHTFGSTAQVDPQNTKDLLYLLGCAVFAFSVALGSGMLLKGSDKPAIVAFVQELLAAPKTRQTETKSEAA